jgi:hypothetical protein
MSKQKKFYEIHRSDAVNILLRWERHPNKHTNVRLGELLEEYHPGKSTNRTYIVKEDDLPLDNPLTLNTF